MSRSTMIIFVIGFVLLIYGYLCRLLSIYFFWDSKYFGWLGIISAILLLLIDIRMNRIRQKQNIFFVRMMVAVVVIFLALEGSAIVWLKTSAAYKGIIDSINKDQSLRAEIGTIRGYGLIPGINILEIIKAASSESLTFTITVRGEKSYKEFEYTIERTIPMNWRVTSMRSF